MEQPGDGRPALPLTDAALREIIRESRGQHAPGGKPWTQSRGSEGLVPVLMPAAAAVYPKIQELLGGRALEPIEVVALIASATILGLGWMLCRTWLKVTAAEAGS